VNKTVVSVTTIQMTLADCLTATGMISPVNGIAVYQTAIAFGECDHRLCGLFSSASCSSSVSSPLLTAIFYNGIFRWVLTGGKPERSQSPKEKTARERISRAVLRMKAEKSKRPVIRPGNSLCSAGAERL
jgi:hypothetical protein